MKISLLQSNIVWGNPTANQEKLDEILWGLEKSDLYVLPEMFSTGFAVEPKGVAEADESSLAWIGMETTHIASQMVPSGNILSGANWWLMV